MDGVKDARRIEQKQKHKTEELRSELEKVKQRREEREREKAAREEERTLMQREKEASLFSVTQPAKLQKKQCGGVYF